MRLLDETTGMGGHGRSKRLRAILTLEMWTHSRKLEAEFHAHPAACSVLTKTGPWFSEASSVVWKTISVWLQMRNMNAFVSVCTLFQLKTFLVSCQQCHFHIFMWWVSTAAYFETEVIINLPTFKHCKHISISNEIRPKLKYPHLYFR